jgi:hypothetical protein
MKAAMDLAAKERSEAKEPLDEEEETVINPFDSDYSVSDIEIAPIEFKRNKCWSEVYERDEVQERDDSTPRSRQKPGMSSSNI